MESSRVVKLLRAAGRVTPILARDTNKTYSALLGLEKEGDGGKKFLHQPSPSDKKKKTVGSQKLFITWRRAKISRKAVGRIVTLTYWLVPPQGKVGVMMIKNRELGGPFKGRCLPSGEAQRKRERNSRIERGVNRAK